MQAQARQGFELLATPLHAHWHEALAGRQHGVGGLFGAEAPEQRLELEARTAAGFTQRVAAVLGQQHANVHFVGLAFEVGKESLDAKPVLVPLAVPAWRAIDDPALLLGRELVPRRVARNA